jgi:toxin-antitoxin system PIN domain toxin
MRERPVIVPDINLLVYAHNQVSAVHAPARAWWEDLVAREQPIGLCWAVIFGFVRLVTHPAVMMTPLPVDAALARVEGWLALDCVRILDPGPRHLAVAKELFAAAGVGANLTTDVHLAALAIDYQAELHSNDTDFARFSGLRWHNPLAG